ncbi:MAG: ATP phosphoribosyltransferase [Marinilabiliales bacterium]|nr:MAG: ATP phosphoribosyltransferase [Marinilabiliales bacterium]
MKKLKIAIQKKGRLNEKSVSLLKEAGIKVNNGSGKLIASSPNFPLEILFLRDDDIPAAVANGVADIGIVGLNEILEKKCRVNIVKELDFAKCRMSIAVPKSFDYEGIKDLKGKIIATSYPVILNEFLAQNKISAKVTEISGSVEIAPGIGMADGIFDIVSTGSTLISNGLKEVEVVMKSEAVLIASQQLANNQKEILDKLLFRIDAVQNALNNKYILLNAPNESIDSICEILPGMKSPTILPLARKGWSSLHSVVKENEFWDVIEKLKECGAQGILVVPIEKMVV